MKKKHFTPPTHRLILLAGSLILFLFDSLFATLPDIQDEQELLHARRIIDFWKDQEAVFTRSEIEKFFSLYPKSSFHDHFYAILGDMAVEEKRYAQALSSYSLIRNPDILLQTRLNRWNALYQLKQYALLYQEIAPQKNYIHDEEGLFYFAEAALREALTMDESVPQGAIRHRLLEEAFEMYDLLSANPRFGSHAKLAMAEIYRHTGQLEEAADLYLQSALEQKSPQNLYHAALLLMQCQREEKAIEIFARLAKSGSCKAADAAYHWLQLLAKNKQWEIICREKRLFLSVLHPSHLCIYHFYVGMLAYEEGDYIQSIKPLQDSLQGGLKPPYDKGALLAILIAGKELAQPEATEYAYSLIQDRYPEELEEASLLRATCYHKAHLDERALELFSELLTVATKPKIIEEAHLAKIHLLIMKKAWTNAQEQLTLFMKHFPLSDHSIQIMKLSVDIALAQLSQPHENHYKTLAAALQKALDSGQVYRDQEALEKRLLLSKCFIKLNQPAQALFHLKQLISQGYESAELHYLLASAYVKEGCHPELVIHEGETTLSLDPQFSEADRLHLYLFNAYLQSSHHAHHTTFTECAAAHLYAIIDRLPISLENQLWLAHTYAKQLGMESRAIHILEKILLSKEDQLKNYPEEAFLLAHLYQKQEKYAQALSLLTPLYERESLAKIGLVLAMTYEGLGSIPKAKELFLSLEEDPDNAIAYTSRLHLARLALECSESWTEKQKPLKILKDLWLHKDLLSEPIHLEAALDYLETVKSHYLPEDYLALLTEIKTHFTTTEDIYSKDYHAARALHPDKDHIYQSYMRFLEAKIYISQASQPHLANVEAQNKKRAARALIATLTQGHYPLTPYLMKKTEMEVQ